MDGRSQLSRKGRVDVALIIQTVHWRPFQRLKHSTLNGGQFFSHGIVQFWIEKSVNSIGGQLFTTIT